MEDQPAASSEVIEQLYQQYRRDPQSVEPSWRHFFMGLDFAPEAPREVGEAPSELRVDRLIEAYRNYGHLLAHFNPIDVHPVEQVSELDLRRWGFAEEELDRMFPTCGLLDREEAPLKEIVEVLKETYCGRIGVEYCGLQSLELERWLQAEIEPKRFRPHLSIEQKKEVLSYLNKAELFEIFLHTKYVGQKRFSLEGGEMLIPLMRLLIDVGANMGTREFVIGMAHRGRLNVLTNILNKSYATIFHEFEDSLQESSFQGSGDVKYHKGYSGDVTTLDGKGVHLSVTANPSHLESVDAVVEGQVRAKQILKGDELVQGEIVPLLIHGDASVAGQGIVYETMQLSRLSGYSTGGTIHLVVNNQIGFTTLPKDSRSTRYCTDIARAFSAPVFHVNGEDAEGCVYAAMLAMELRHRFHCDVFIDLNCWRKYGHNEADEPAFTQPLEYKIIRNKKSPREVYRDELIEQGIVERQVAEALEKEFRSELQKELDEVQSLQTEPPADTATPEWKKIREANQQEESLPETGVAVELLRRLADGFCKIPDGFVLNRKVKRMVEQRLEMMTDAIDEPKVNWGLAEHLAFSSLLWEGREIRISGQDSRRGTFNHRHAMWVDQEKEWKYFPLNHVSEGQGRFDVFNSPLSEEAVLGFELGYSYSNPKALVIWEAQFGDFANSAQVILDQYLATTEQKWDRFSGLVLLLPHGYEGQGPEHSSARIERYLQLAAENNMRVINPTTPVQLFHVLRAQVLRTSRKPLIVFTPKSLLGHPQCLSCLRDFEQGEFRPVLDDPHPPKACRVLAFCTGRLYYDLLAEREKRGAHHVALVRIEQLYPVAEEAIRALAGQYATFERCYWVQEEPENMGAWDFMRPVLRQLLPEGKEAGFLGRPRSASPATGSPKRHKSELTTILNQLFGKVS